MAVFHDSMAALQFALDLEADPGPAIVRIRAGVHVGRVLVQPGDTFGNEVNLAARISSQGKQGGIWISDQVHLDSLRDDPSRPLSWTQHEKVRLDGFEPELFTLWSLPPTKPAPPTVTTAAASIYHLPSSLSPSVRLPCDRPPRARAGQLFGRDAQLDDLLGSLRQRKDTCVWGPAGFGKTALAAEAIHRLLLEAGDDLAGSPFPGGIVLLDLYRLSDHGQRRQLAEQAWYTLADRFDPAQPADQPARIRATRACAGRQALVVVEGAEEARDGRHLTDLLSVLDGTVTRLVLTRNKAQAAWPHSLRLDAELAAPDALALLRKLAGGSVPEGVLRGVVTALGGHPLALTWAGCQLEREEEPAASFLKELQRGKLPGIHEPGYEDHTLKWLYERSARKLSDDARRVLAAAGLLAAAPFGVGAAVASLQKPGSSGRESAQTSSGAKGFQSRLTSAATGDVEDLDSRAREALRQLVRHGLLRVVPNEERWEFTHALAARFAGAQAVADTTLLRALSQWMLDAFQEGLDHFRRTEDFGRLQAASLHAAALLGRDAAGDAADRLADWLLYNGQDLFLALGRLGHARDALNAIAACMRRQPESLRGTSQWRREHLMLFEKFGNVFMVQGELAQAKEAYKEYHAGFAKLVAESPNNNDYQRTLSVSLVKLGNVQLAQGDLAGARASYEQSRTIREKLAAGDPTNAGWQRDLSVSLNKLGNVQLAQGDLAGARASYEQSRTIREKLAAGDPTNAGWQRDLSVSLNKLGNVQLAQGDLAGARASYEQSRTIREKLAAGNPTNAGWQRDLEVSRGKLGEVAVKAGDTATARREFIAALAIAERLTKLDPTNATWRSDIAWLREQLAQLPPQ